MMDCDTTGIEPDLALVKYKKLVGGGLIKIVNNVVPTALLKLGYTDEQAADIVSYIEQHGTIEGAPGLKPEHLPVFDCSLKPAKGKRSIHYMGHVRMMAAVQPFLSGAISKTVNMPEEATTEDIANVYIEGWRLGLKSVAIYRDGSKRVQPLSISKGQDSGFRSPRSLGSDGPHRGPEIGQDSGAKEQESGVRSQKSGGDAPLDSHGKQRPRRRTAVRDDLDKKAEGSEKAEAPAPSPHPPAPSSEPPAPAPEPATPTPKPYRRKLPDERRAVTHKFSVGAHEGYLTVGLYEDGQPGEIFITMAKEGSTVSGLMDSFATAVSLALQYGVPLKVLCDKFSHMRFEPSGWTNNPEIRYAKSIMDYIFRWMAYKFLPKDARPQEDASVASLNGTEVEKAAGLAAQFTQAAGGVAGAEVGQPGLAGVEHSEDAPSCSDCGAIMVRNGSCYKCLNCGATSGCS
jgi:ribonucleoside-diphosphate reductase alpha chain